MSPPTARPGHAVLVCHRRNYAGPIAVECTYWDTTGQARQAEAELTPCGPLCIGVHSVVRVDLQPAFTRGRWSRTRTTGTDDDADRVEHT
ncbi:hypothetical protein MMAN_09560 [Mycobacterium mantenii]|uniref:Uncharacterized protein n=1 Tax=Mycobacterium mantenii TaxID=560555 RepID=A0A1X0G190_MYCNT|nr:hypothetical protein [Mycobacterium mantenii]MCV7244735.1 hypothetical protein [Mycobacterium mantenii]ORB07519.1 hypothetical protein BST30_06105 [Mycobacterium mantenii]BBY36822.1 hypothetical protein MMAN_09560 [Mycobacterium mantenii]